MKPSFNIWLDLVALIIKMPSFGDKEAKCILLIGFQSFVISLIVFL